MICHFLYDQPQQFLYRYLFSGANLASVSVHKHLGLTFSSGLKWNNQIDDINVLADKRLCQQEALRFKLNRNTLEIVRSIRLLNPGR